MASATEDRGGESLDRLNPQAAGGDAARFWLIAALVFFGAAMRLVPHPWNMAPIGAMALFGGAYFSRTLWALLVPLAAMVTSDLCLWAFLDKPLSWQPYVYAALLVYLGLGLLLRRRQPLFATAGRTGWDALAVAGSAIAGSIAYFLITNFQAWLWLKETYARSWQGLLDCYVAGVPFFRGTLAGDLLYTGVLFGALALCERRWPAFARPDFAAPAVVSVPANR